AGDAARRVARPEPAHLALDRAETLAGPAPRTAMSAPSVHIVGAGLAGLAAAVALADEGRRVVLYESGQQAGGRCRSYVDSELGCLIDNGNHLLLSGNTASIAYVERIGALDTFAPAGEAAIPFIDLATGEHWAVRPN